LANPEDWTQWLDIATTVHNNRKNSTTSLSPNQILISYEPELIPSEMPSSNNKTMENRIKTLRENHIIATNAINQAIKGNGTIAKQYSIEDLIWLEAKNLKFQH
jgi:hypothetical protein